MISVRTVDSKNPKFKSNSKFNFTDLLVVANAVFRKNGYVKTADVPHIIAEGEAVKKLPNVVIVRHYNGLDNDGDGDPDGDPILTSFDGSYSISAENPLAACTGR